MIYLYKFYFLLILAFHSIVIQTPKHTVLVDTCGGNDKHRPQKVRYHHKHHPYLTNLSRAGFSPEQIDVVLCTHLPVDHVGWNTMWVDGRWMPTFDKARYLIGETEWNHWSREGATQARGENIMGDSVQPVFDAGLVDLVQINHKICDEVWLESTPGHTPGGCSFLIDDAIFVGDTLFARLPGIFRTACSILVLVGPYMVAAYPW